MSWTVIAKKDFRDAIRSKALWALAVLFILFAGGFTYISWIIPKLIGQQNMPATGPTAGLISGLSGSAGFLVPLIGLLVWVQSNRWRTDQRQPQAAARTAT